MNSIAAPKYAIGERVRYLDQHDRQQTGEVYRIEASWTSYTEMDPLIIYTISHPTYRNNRMHCAESNILGSAYLSKEPDQ